MRKFAIISVDDNPDYYQLLPLTCYSLNKLGYRPVIVWLASRELLSIMNDHMDAVILLHNEKYGKIEGVRRSTLAQIGRLFAHEWEMFKADDIILTSDSDMVIAHDIFTHDVSQGQIVSYGFDLTGRSELPICYVKATAAKWRELMGEFHIPEKAYSERWEDYWSVDQQLLTQRAREYGMDRIIFIDRGNQNKHGLPTGRWDRYDWAHIPDSIIDVHMPRNSWDTQIQVAKRLWPGEDHSFITKFREALNEQAIKDVAEAYNYPAQIIEPQQSINLNVPLGEFYEQFNSPVMIDMPDKFGFLEGIDNWSNHRPLLLLALHLAGGDVYEFGAGDGSTSYLRSYCEATGRRFRSFESNELWALKCGSEFVKNWDDDLLYWPCSVAFVDHAPGEHRKVAIERMMDSADIIVVHDTEQGGAGDYGFEPVFAKFRFRLNYNKTGGGAGATAVSNKIDLNRFRGLKLGQYQFDND